MNGLFPIIRRKRRPLIVADVPPDAAGLVQPVVAKPLVESTPVTPKPEQPKTSDVENISQTESE
jgi:hypothetical protein